MEQEVTERTEDVVDKSPPLLPVKKYIVRLSGEERRLLEEVIKKLKGTNQKVQRAQILLIADANRRRPLQAKIRLSQKLSCDKVREGQYLRSSR